LGTKKEVREPERNSTRSAGGPSLTKKTTGKKSKTRGRGGNDGNLHKDGHSNRPTVLALGQCGMKIHTFMKMALDRGSGGVLI